MEDLYKSLGFKQPNFLENPYGIKIYCGTKGESDWCVAIPKKIAKKKCKYYTGGDYNVYFVTEEEALRISNDFTILARMGCENNGHW